MRAYLIGSIEFSPDKGLKWRRRFAKELKKLNIDSIIPNDEEKDILKDINMKELKKSNINMYIDIMRKLISRDLKFVENADMIICYWEGTFSAGTIHEAGHAFQLNKPTYLVSSMDETDIPGWFLACFTERFYSLKHLIKFLKGEE